MATVALPDSSGSDGNQGSKYVIQFLWKYQDFWKAELDSVLALFNLNPSNIYNSEDLENITTPFIFATFSTVEDVKKVCSRCLLINRIYKVFGVGKTDDEIVSDVKNHDAKEYNLFKRNQDLLTDTTKSWKINVGAFGKKLNLKLQQEKRALFSFIPFKGRVKLKNPDLTFWFIEEYTPKGVPSGVEDTRLPVNKYFLLELASGRGDLPVKYSLKQRKFLGPTSMNAELAFIMANNALARGGTFVLDPFVGTGSILVAAQAFGALSRRTLISECCTLKTSEKMQIYFKLDHDLPKPCLVLGRRKLEYASGRMLILDAIICDPPYGVRAVKKSGSKEVAKIPEEYLKSHIPTRNHMQRRLCGTCWI